jgi:H+/Cl- antiporter ClcA
LTGNLALLGPLLAATGAAYAVTVLLLKRSILTEKIARRGSMSCANTASIRSSSCASPT